MLDVYGIILSKRCVVFGYLDGRPALGGGKTFFIALRRALADCNRKERDDGH